MTVKIYVEQKACPTEIDLTLTAVKHLKKDGDPYLLDNENDYILDSDGMQIETIF